MAYSESDAERIRSLLSDRDDVVEKQMFGGLAFMVRGHMCVGLVGEELMVRVGARGHADALAQAHARPMDFTGKSMRGLVFVGFAGWSATRELKAWLQRGLDYVESLPAKD